MPTFGIWKPKNVQNAALFTNYVWQKISEHFSNLAIEICKYTGPNFGKTGTKGYIEHKWQEFILIHSIRIEFFSKN